MATLPTNLKDDILDASVNQRRRYNMITNPDGTVEFEDVTVYSQVGSEYGAGLINETNKQINGKVDDSKIVRDLKTIGAMTQEGFIPDALALKEVNESLSDLFSDTIETVTLPFTASTGGMLYVFMKENNSSTSYLYLNSEKLGNDICHISTASSAGLSKTQWFPIVKGDTISVRVQSCANYSCKFLPFN